MELVAIVDPATVTWSKYNLDMKPTKKLAEMYQVLTKGFALLETVEWMMLMMRSQGMDSLLRFVRTLSMPCFAGLNML